MQDHRALRPLLVSLLVLGGCSLADIRPAELQLAGVTEASAERGRQLLEAMQIAHGGRERWSTSGYTLAVVRDDWPGAVSRTLFAPWPARDYPMRLTFENGADNSRADFFVGDWQGRVWGIQNWATYTADATDGEPVFEQDDTIKFWLPTMQYFIEAPFRLPEAPIVADAGQAEFRGETYDRVFVTWVQPEPHESVDQYVLFLNPRSHMLVWLEYTVRDFGEGQDSDEIVHQMTLSELEFKPELDPAFVVPRPDIRRDKHE